MKHLPKQCPKQNLRTFGIRQSGGHEAGALTRKVIELGIGAAQLGVVRRGQGRAASAQAAARELLRVLVEIRRRRMQA
jgi:hypothetical protein